MNALGRFKSEVLFTYGRLSENKLRRGIMMYATTSLLSPILVAYAVSWNGFQARLLPPQAALPDMY